MASYISSTASRAFTRASAPVTRTFSTSLRPTPRPHSQHLQRPLTQRFQNSRRGLATPSGEQPRIRLGSIAPNFQAKTTHGDIDFHQFIDNKWAILFSHPADFTPVCTTELGAFAKMAGDFEKRNVKMIGLVWDFLSIASRSESSTSINTSSRQHANKQA